MSKGIAKSRRGRRGRHLQYQESPAFGYTPSNGPPSIFDNNQYQSGYNNNAPSANFNNNSPHSSYNSNLPNVNYNSNTPNGNYNSNTPHANFNSNTANGNYNNNAPNGNYNSNTPHTNFNNNSPHSGYNNLPQSNTYGPLPYNPHNPFASHPPDFDREAYHAAFKLVKEKLTQFEYKEFYYAYHNWEAVNYGTWYRGDNWKYGIEEAYCYVRPDLIYCQPEVI